MKQGPQYQLIINTPFYRNNNTNILNRILDLENCFLLLFRKQHKGLIPKLTAFLPQERVLFIFYV